MTRLLKAKTEHLAMAYTDAYQEGALKAAEAAAYQRHLNSCPECQAWVAEHNAIGR